VLEFGKVDIVLWLFDKPPTRRAVQLWVFGESAKVFFDLTNLQHMKLSFGYTRNLLKYEVVITLW